MKKLSVVLSGLGLILAFSACSQKSGSIPDPVSDPAGNISGMVDLKNKAEKNIQDSTNKENGRLNNTLNENNMNPNQSAVGENSELVKKYPFALIKTSLGEIKISFDSANTPVTVGNFLKLSQSGFYNGTKFHRVIKSFMIQGGDPLSKDEAMISRWGTGGPGYQFNDELKGTEKYSQGTLAMANAGPNTNGSQFFIVTASPGYPLPPSYTIFGQVVAGMDIALKIENVKTGSNDRPVEDVVIKSVEILER
jgi:cyclophilin family peptidyl-prolyl cis-trans isomerase